MTIKHPRNFLITGAAGGMGRAVIRLLAERDVNLVCLDRDAESLHSALEPWRGRDFIPVTGDAADAAVVEAAVADGIDRLGGFDGLFNIAGSVGEMGSVITATDDTFDDIMRANVRSVWIATTRILPSLLQRGGGTIVSTGSYLAIRGHVNGGAYAAAKHAVVGLSKTVALEHARDNIRVNVVSPGAMNTPMIRKQYPLLSDDPSEAEQEVVSHIPQGRMAEPSELAAAGVWLLLDAPEHLTGQVITVDGGRSAG